MVDYRARCDVAAYFMVADARLPTKDAAMRQPLHQHVDNHRNHDDRRTFHQHRRRAGGDGFRRVYVHYQEQLER